MIQSPLLNSLWNSLRWEVLLKAWMREFLNILLKSPQSGFLPFPTQAFHRPNQEYCSSSTKYVVPPVGKGKIFSKIISATADGFSTGLSPLKQIVSNKKLTLAVSVSRAARREAYASTTHQWGEGNLPGPRFLWNSDPRGRCPSEALTPLWHLLSLGRADKGVLQGAAQDRQRRSYESSLNRNVGDWPYPLCVTRLAFFVLTGCSL